MKSKVSSFKDHTQFLNAIGREPLLAPAEELHLARLVQAGMAPDATELDKKRGHKARNRMIRANMRLAIAEANKQAVTCQSMEFRDLVQEAALGLARATEKFDPALGYKFSTYAYWWVRQAIKRSAGTHDNMVRIPIHLRDGTLKARRIADDARSEGRELSVGEIAQKAKLNPVAWEAAQLISQVGSLNSLCGKNENGEVVDTVATPDVMSALERIEEEELREKIGELLDALPGHDGEMLRRYYGIDRDPQTLTAIGKDLGVSREAVRQKCDRGRRRLTPQIARLLQEEWI